MADGTEKTPLERIVELFNAKGVRFIVIGGQAETLHGSPRVTYDVDICYERTRPNLERLAEALRELRPTLRGAPADLPFRIDADALALGSNFTFATDLGDLDLLGHVEPIGGFDELAKHVETIRVGDFDLWVISLDDLIRIKGFLGRPKDKESLTHLLAIRRVREEGER